MGRFSWHCSSFPCLHGQGFRAEAELRDVRGASGTGRALCGIRQRLVVLLLLPVPDGAGRGPLGAAVRIHTFSQSKNESGAERHGCYSAFADSQPCPLTSTKLANVIRYNHTREACIYSVARCLPPALMNAIAVRGQGTFLSQFKVKVSVRERGKTSLALRIRHLRYRRVSSRSPRIQREVRCSGR